MGLDLVGCCCALECRFMNWKNKKENIMNHSSEKTSTELSQIFAIGDKVVVNKCSTCDAIVGKTATVSLAVSADGDSGISQRVSLNFGRGRPQTGRPVSFLPSELSLVKE
jgi:hypothetical protein